jgi:hypothetical protein
VKRLLSLCCPTLLLLMAMLLTYTLSPTIFTTATPSHRNYTTQALLSAGIRMLLYSMQFCGYGPFSSDLDVWQCKLAYL